jgi:nitrite reductase/ring-hydroxylating ferredoxin subunit
MGEWVQVCEVNALKDGEIKKFKLRNKDYLIARVGDQVYCFSPFCPHKGGLLERGKILPECRIECPLHGYVFDLHNGKPVLITYSPSYGKWRETGDLQVFPVLLSKGKVHVRVED